MSNPASVENAATVRSRALRLLRPEVVDVASLGALRTVACSVAECGGACCRDGAGLIPEEELLLTELVRAYSSELRSLGTCAPGVTRAGGVARTAVATLATGQSCCSWLTGDGRCSLQVLGERHTDGAWKYKPIACILIPLRVRTRENARVLTADRRAVSLCPESDPCMRHDPTAAPLHAVSAELRFVKEIWDLDVPALVEAGVRDKAAGGT